METAVVAEQPVDHDGNGDLVCATDIGTYDDALCNEALDALEDAKALCDTSQAPDVWFQQSACDNAVYDGYDNTAFYTCLIDKFLVTDVSHICETNANGDPTAVRQFEDISQSADPAGCRELYQASPETSGGGTPTRRSPQVVHSTAHSRR